MNFKMMGEVHKNNVDDKVWVTERGNVGGIAFGRTALPDDLPAILGEKAGDCAAEATKGNTAIAELHDKWNCVI